MSDKITPVSDSESPAIPAVALGSRRSPSPRSKKPRSKAVPGDEPASGPVETAEPSPETPSPSPASPPPEPRPEPQGESDAESDMPSPESEWPAPETSGAQAQEGGKRKRRRRKKGGQGGQSQSQHQTGETTAESGEPQNPADATSQQRQQHAPRPPQSQRPKVEPALLAKRAWKIYLSEISEEGVALVNDQDARELTRRCFRLAEIFLEEQARRS